MNMEECYVSGTGRLKKYRCEGCQKVLSNTSWSNHRRDGCAVFSRSAPSIPCPHDDCQESFHTKEKMTTHYSENHQPLEIHTKTVRGDLGLENIRLYVEMSGGCKLKKWSASAAYMYFKCQMEKTGMPKIGNHMGAVAIYDSCTSYIVATRFENDIYQVRFCNVHSHETPNKPQNIPWEESIFADDSILVKDEEREPVTDKCKLKVDSLVFKKRKTKPLPEENVKLEIGIDEDSVPGSSNGTDDGILKTNSVTTLCQQFNTGRLIPPVMLTRLKENMKAKPVNMQPASAVKSPQNRNHQAKRKSKSKPEDVLPVSHKILKNLKRKKPVLTSTVNLGNLAKPEEMQPPLPKITRHQISSNEPEESIHSAGLSKKHIIHESLNPSNSTQEKICMNRSTTNLDVTAASANEYLDEQDTFEAPLPVHEPARLMFKEVKMEEDLDVESLEPEIVSPVHEQDFQPLCEEVVEKITHFDYLLATHGSDNQDAQKGVALMKQLVIAINAFSSAVSK